MKMIYNSIKQLLRTPIKTTLFLLLLTFSGVLFSLGTNLWALNSRNIRNYEQTFSTIGTVEQRPSFVAQTEEWDAEQKGFRIYNRPQYSELLNLSLLSFYDENYVQKPEKRVHYGSYAPDYKLVETSWRPPIVEFTPLEDCIPDKPVKVRVENILYGEVFIAGNTFWFCDHNEPNPQPLYMGKTYVALLQLMFAHKDMVNNKDMSSMSEEYVPLSGISSSQFDSDGLPVKDRFSDECLYYEVTESFYENEPGKRWQELLRACKMLEKTHPVTVTNATNLLMPFYNGDAYVSAGQDIQEIEFLNGDKVCLIPKNFADRNNLSVGDTLRLQLYYADHKDAANENFSLYGGGGFSSSFLNARGEAYAVFYDNIYTVTGIYDISPGADQGDYGMGSDEVIIPMRSIENNDENSILAYGPMCGNTTSFQIQNGQIEHFMTEWEKYGNKELEIVFYDMGYSSLKPGLDNMRNMSFIFLATGVITVVLIILFFCNIFISKQRVRTAIERSLGMSKRKCAISLLSGILIIVFLGSVLGCTVGGALIKSISANIQGGVYYDTTFSSGMATLEAKGDTENKGEIGDSTQMVVLVSTVSGVLILIWCILISAFGMALNLKHEPLYLLGTKME